MLTVDCFGALAMRTRPYHDIDLRFSVPSGTSTRQLLRRAVWMMLALWLLYCWLQGLEGLASAQCLDSLVALCIRESFVGIDRLVDLEITGRASSPLLSPSSRLVGDIEPD